MSDSISRDDAIIGLAVEIYEEQAEGFGQICTGLEEYIAIAKAKNLPAEDIAQHEDALREAARMRNTAKIIVGYIRGYRAASSEALTEVEKSKALTEREAEQ